jgi:hypothetical protein
MELLNINNMLNYGYNIVSYKDNLLLLSILLNYILFLSYVYVSHNILLHFNYLFQLYKKIKKIHKKIKKLHNKTPDNWEDLYNDSLNNYKIIKQYIKDATNEELNEVLEFCSKKVLIPNWYTKDNLESVIFRPITEYEWVDILDDYEGYNDINNVIYDWYK